MQRHFVFLALPLALSGCFGRLDYHGTDPRTYQEVVAPKKNQVEFKSMHQVFEFTSQDQFAPDTLEALDLFVATTYPSAVDRLVIAMPHTDDARALYLTRELRRRGFKKSVMEYVFDEGLAENEVVVQMDYSAVIAPQCPDWSKASALNYSNTNYSNMECATVTNLGRQVANPKHLIQSDQMHVTPDGKVGANAISNYRGSTSGASNSTAGSTGSTAPSTPAVAQ